MLVKGERDQVSAGSCSSVRSMGKSDPVITLRHIVMRHQGHFQACLLDLRSAALHALDDGGAAHEGRMQGWSTLV